MKKGFDDTAEKKSMAPAGRVSASSGGQNLNSVASKNKKNVDGAQLPALVEFVYSISAIIVILVSLIVAVISFLSGSSLMDLVIRTGVSILVTGVIFMLIAWQISSDVLKAGLAELAEEKEKAEKEAREKEEQEDMQRKEREKAERMQDPMGETIFEEMQ